jgi:SNF2 family DNA or RNA helicase
MALIRKAAVEAFLNRDRRDFRRYKDFSLRELQRRVERLPIKPPIWKRLRQEQRVGFIAGVKTRKFCFWYDMGMGKTLLAVALARYFKRLGVARRILVLIPNKINKYEWAEDLKKHSPLSTFTILEGSTKHKWEQVQADDSHFILETYAGLVRMLTVSAKVKGKKKTKLVAYDPAKRALLKLIGGIVMDESIHVIRKHRHGSLAHRLCRFYAARCPIAYALNGTPFGKDPADMWGQFHIIDQGETLGETLGLFRAAFFKSKDDYWGGTKHTFDKTKKKLLNQIIANRSLRYEADESTLPRISMIPKEVSLPGGADEYYEKARQQIIASKGNYQELKNAFLRMRQISSGFVGYDDDETGERARYAFTPNPKLEQTMSIIEEVAPTYKVVVFHDFTFSGDLIAEQLKKMKLGFARLYGKTKDPGEQLTRFHKTKNCRVFLLQNRSGGFGLDRLKVARYGICYESPVGTVLRQQIIRRVRRQGSEHGRVFWYDVITRGTVDRQILDAHEAGIDLFKAVVNGKMKLRKYSSD